MTPVLGQKFALKKAALKAVLSSPPPLYPADLPFSSYVDTHLKTQLS